MSIFLKCGVDIKTVSYTHLMMGFTENYVKIVSDYDASLVNRVIEIEIGKLDEKHMAMEAIFLNHQKQKCK